MVRPLEGSGFVAGERIRSERRLAQTDVHRVVKALHPIAHPGATPPTGPAVRDAVKDPPKGSTESNPRGEPDGAHRAHLMETHRLSPAVCIGRDLVFPQRRW